MNRRLNNLEESVTLALNAKAKALASSGKEVFNLSAGELDCATPEYIAKAVAARLDENKYTPAAGLPELRQAIADHCAKFYGAPWIKPDHITVTAGAKPGLFGIFQVLLNEGDEVIVPTPAWVSYQQMIEIAGGKMITVPLTKTYDLNVASIKNAITARTKAIVINSPNNPTGSVFSESSLKELATLLNDTEIYLISDDLYSRLVYEPFKPITSSGIKTERLIIVNGFSKSQALTGWRIGYVIAPSQIADTLQKVLSHTAGNAPLPSQIAAEAALARNDDPPLLPELKARRLLVAKGLDGIIRLSYVMPAGAFYFFLDVRKLTNDSVKWCEDLLDQEGVALVPGDAFFASGFVRLSFAADQKTLKEALARLKRFAGQGSLR